MPSVVDHSIHGLVTIRLVGAPPKVLRSLVSMLGPSHDEAAAEPDISVSFNGALQGSSGLRFLGLNEAAFDDESFYLLDGAGRRIGIDFRALGDHCTLVCEPGVIEVPMLLPIIGLRLLRKGHVLLHSSAFTYGGKGTLVTGWQKGGKTEMLLAFMAAGAEYLADEWAIVSGDGQALYGLPSILQIWSWHLRYLPQYWARLDRRQRNRLRILRLYQRLYRLITAKREPAGFPFDVLHRLSLEGGNSGIGQVRSPPERLFDEEVSYSPASIERLFFATSSEGPTTARAIEGIEVARRMVASLSWERRHLMAAYQQFKFAFPDRRNSWLEDVEVHELDLLSQAFASKGAYEVSHPYPVALDELLRAAAPLYD